MLPPTLTVCSICVSVHVHRESSIWNRWKQSTCSRTRTLRAGLIVSSKTLGRRKLVMQPADIARVYIREGTFVYDLLAVAGRPSQRTLSRSPMSLCDV